MTARRTLEKRTVTELMSRDLLTISAEESVLMAWELMCQAAVHHLPVIDGEGGFVGVVDAQTLTATWNAVAPQRARRRVTTLLPRRTPVTVRPAATVAQAARVMFESEADHVAVTDEDNRLVGLLTARDLIGALAGVHRDIAPGSSSMPSLYRIEPVLPSHAAAHPHHSNMGPD